MAETNRQSLNLGPALVRLLTTNVHLRTGQHKNSNGLTVNNSLPSGVTHWESNTNPYLTGVTATNLGSKNAGLAGDAIVGYFKPLDASFTTPGHENDAYFMIVNGLSDAAGFGSRFRQLIAPRSRGLRRSRIGPLPTSRDRNKWKRLLL